MFIRIELFGYALTIGKTEYEAEPDEDDTPEEATTRTVYLDTQYPMQTGFHIADMDPIRPRLEQWEDE